MKHLRYLTLNKRGLDQIELDKVWSVSFWKWSISLIGFIIDFILERTIYNIN